MEQVEIILRTRESSGKTKEQILAVFQSEQALCEKEQEFSRLRIDPTGHKVSYAGKELPLSELEYQLLLYLASPYIFEEFVEFYVLFHNVFYQQYLDQEYLKWIAKGQRLDKFLKQQYFYQELFLHLGEQK